MATTACVIGAGPGGYVAAIRLARLGIATTLVEKLPVVGGVCLNWGCIPSKALIQVSRLWSELGRATEVGISYKEAVHDMSQSRHFKDQIVRRLNGGIRDLLKKNGVKLIQGQAKFSGPQRLVIKLPGGQSQTLLADAFVVATGSRPLAVPGFPVDEERILSSKGMLNLEQVPKHLLVIGGGVIGLEIGQCMLRFGARLTVVEMLDQLLPGTDPDCARVVARQLKKAGASIFLESRAKSMTREPEGISVVIQGQRGEKNIQADRVLVAVGRRPNSEELGLKLAGVQTDSRGFIQTDGACRTANKNIFAIGDVAGAPLLAHKASREGLVAAAAIAGEAAVMDAVVPSAIFTDPEIASAGLTQAQAEAQGFAVTVGTFPFAASGRALAERAPEGFVKMVADSKDDRLLGVQICGAHASELVAEATLALEAGLTAEDLALTIHTHPTLSESLMEAAEDIHHLAVHIYHPAAHGKAAAGPRSRA